MIKDQKHNKLIMEQFSKQAVPFSKKVPAHSNQTAFKLIINTVSIDKNDIVLDVACGPGMLTTAVAQKASKVTGIDLVPAMIRQSKIAQKKNKLLNMDWKIGDVTKLPFPDGSFSVVLTRFSFHHFLKPQKVLKEMVRVAKPKGKVGVVDVFTKSPTHSKLHNLMEKLRDDSHVKALSLDDLQKLAIEAGFKNIKTKFYDLEIELEQQLSASFPKPGKRYCQMLCSGILAHPVFRSILSIFCPLYASISNDLDHPQIS